MPSGGAGRHWKPTGSAGKDSPRCACGDGRTARRSLAGVPLCRQHVGGCLQALGSDLSRDAVLQWVEARRATVVAAE
ncbi:MAG: hypothetical protein M1118_07815 [Chloroflexi bacterium]|nr:hypothetical protein [Chloroflexota bacterium]